MATTDRTVSNPIINVLTKAQYQSITNPSQDEIYLITDDALAEDVISASIGTAAGDIIYFSAAGTPARLAKGTNGQVLKMVNNLPAWAANDTFSASVSGEVLTLAAN